MDLQSQKVRVIELAVGAALRLLKYKLDHH